MATFDTGERIDSRLREAVQMNVKNGVDVNRKVEIYRTLHELNVAFAAIVEHCNTLQRTGLFSKTAKLFPVSRKSCKPSATKNFSKLCIKWNWMIGVVTAESARSGRSISKDQNQNRRRK